MAMDFIGTGTRLKPDDLLVAADKLMTGVAVIRAVIEVEAAGAGFDDKRRPKILFEPHIFYKQLGKGPKRDRAVKEGLAYPKAGTKPYPPLSKRYDQIARAMAIDETAALNSASWGLPQIMGFQLQIRRFREREGDGHVDDARRARAAPRLRQSSDRLEACR